MISFSLGNTRMVVWQSHVGLGKRGGTIFCHLTTLSFANRGITTENRGGPWSVQIASSQHIHFFNSNPNFLSLQMPSQANSAGPALFPSPYGLSMANRKPSASVNPPKYEAVQELPKYELTGTGQNHESVRASKPSSKSPISPPNRSQTKRPLISEQLLFLGNKYL
ncbi:hypothetical protein BC830DRAFT_851536 [Chytriomyces sp. MP71]|nr:hypothetical protein BC830DRAFT_851536 [Chytriomyces sp. MP71]